MKRNRAQESIVYIVTNSVNGDQYIGVTCDYLSRRKAKHLWCAIKKNSQTYFHRAIRKYGIENFEFSCVAKFLTFDEALKAEIGYIKERKPKYNMTKGGDGTFGFRVPEDVVRRLADSRRGKAGPWRGKELAPSFIKGGRDWNKSVAGKKSWEKCRVLGPMASAKKVVCLDDGMVFDHAISAARFYGLSGSLIYGVCKKDGKHRTAGGMVFRFFGEHDGGKDEANDVRLGVLRNRQRTAAIARAARVSL